MTRSCPWRFAPRSADAVATVVIGTAGHIDHGKTALLRALTGIDADRLPEEQARGMTIDVGYAHLTFEDGVELDFVDVPGHDRLIGNMLVGAGEIDAAMLVVAADDGPRPQTFEHVQLLDALGIDRGVAVVTKTDAVRPDRTAEVKEQVAALLDGTSLAAAPVITASSITGDGIDDVRSAVRAISDGFREGQVRGPVRLAIDRVFSPKGRGVVVTGTLRGGPIAKGAWLQRAPGGELVRVRSLQVHGEERPSHSGGRTAVNITGDVGRSLGRGDVLGGEGGVRGARDLLIELRQPVAVDGAAVTWPPRSRRGLRAHVGTAQTNAALRLAKEVDGYAIVSLSEPVGTFAGDRLVLRDAAGGEVVASGRVLDLDPPRGAARRRISAVRLGVLREAVDAWDGARLEAALIDLHGVEPGSPTIGPKQRFRELLLAPDVREALVTHVLDAVGAHHAASPLSPGLPLPRARAMLLRRLRSHAPVGRELVGLAKAAIDVLLEDLIADGRLSRRGDALRDPSLASALSADLLAAMDRLETALSVPAPSPLGVAAEAVGCPPDGIRALQADGRIVRIGSDLAWATPTYHGLAGVALELARGAPLTPAAFRDATGTSRRYVLAILEDLDRREILRRTPEGHIPGPRAPRREVKPAGLAG
jgi:selenocysteine-specific elongation factor